MVGSSSSSDISLQRMALGSNGISCESLKSSKDMGFVEYLNHFHKQAFIKDPYYDILTVDIYIYITYMYIRMYFHIPYIV